jgi:diketogulonate reductase-like aldo/keto reductase
VKLKTDYVDLLLLHFPVTELRRPAWRRMEDILKSGKARSIGVSNYTVHHLEELLKECGIKPTVNQIELHVFLQQPELVKYCQDNDIIVEAYSPLAHGYIKDDPILAKIAQKYDKSVTQVMIRWCIDKGLIPLPKAVSHDHIQQNFDVFDFKLGTNDLQEIAKINRDLRTCWDPTHIA